MGTRYVDVVCPRCWEGHQTPEGEVCECPYCDWMFMDERVGPILVPPTPPPAPAAPAEAESRPPDPVSRVPGFLSSRWRSIRSSLEVLSACADRVVRVTPWWSVSFAPHLLILLVAALVAWETVVPPEPTEIAMVRLPKALPVVPRFDFHQAVFDNLKPVRAERAVEDPVFTREADEADHNESETFESFRQAKGDVLSALATRPFRDVGVFDRIGTAGAAGGRYGCRIGGKQNLVSRGGGSAATEGAVLAGLRWLARHQAEDGRWSAAGYAGRCGAIHEGTCSGGGSEVTDTGVTGLALLAFLGAGYTHYSRDIHDGLRFGRVLREGLRWLTEQQDRQGCVGRLPGVDYYMYNHAIAALALSEAYGLTGSGMLKRSAQRAIDFLVRARNPGAGWRYTARSGDTDTSVTGWCVMALKSAEISGLRISRAAYSGARAWINAVTGRDYRVGYVRRGSWVAGAGEGMTAVGVLCRILIDRSRNSRSVRGGGRLLAESKPAWEAGAIDFYAWYYIALALYQVDGPDGPLWSAWNVRMVETLLRQQWPATAGCLAGSWDPVGQWCSAGGRIYATALNVMTLEVYYRYENVFGASKRS